MERHFLIISRALNARKRKIFALFFALAAVVTGAMAQEESLLTTLTFGGSDTYGETTSGVVNVTATNVNSYNGTFGWLLAEGSSLSVTAKEGYTITKCVFRQNAKDPITDTEAPFEIHTNGWGGIIEDPYEEMNGVTSIEVYGYANAGGGSTTTVVTITNNDFPGMDVSFTKDGVTVSADWIDNMQSGNLVAPGSFSTTLGNFTKIEVNAGEVLQLGEGWSGNSERQTWTGNASSVSFSGDISGLGHGITIMCTIEAAAPAKPTLTLSDKVSILGMPVAGITDLGNNNYEVEPGTQFQIQAAAAPEHYNFFGWSDLQPTDPNYTANPRTITINSDSTIKPLYALEAFTITLTSNDTTMGKVTLRAGSGGGEDGDMSIANNADLEGANTSRNIAVGADGSIHVVYKSTEDQSVKYIKSMDGVTFTEPVTVANDARECEVAVSSNGKVYVSYYVENDGGYIAYSADGTNFTNVRVDNNASSIHLATDGDYVYGVNMPGMNFYYSSDGGQTYNMHSGWSGYMFSDVMVDPLNHNVVVIKDEPNVVVRYSTDHGDTFTEEAPVMVQGENDQLAIFFSTATMGDGKVYMAGAGDFVAIIDYKTATCTKTDVNSTDNRSLCADPVGNVIVGVEQGGNLYYQLSTNSAVSFGDIVLVSNGSGANAALNYHDGTLLYLFTKDNKLYLATRTGIVPTESVVDNGDGTYAVQYGTEVTFTAKAKPGYHVESWSNAVEVNDIIVATQTLEVNSAMTIGATFAANPILTIATNDSTKGVVSLEGAGQGGEQGEEAAQITPDMVPQSWQGDETLLTVDDLPGFGSMSEADALEWGLTSAIEGMCKLIYAEADGGKFKFMDFYNGGYSMDDVSFIDHDYIYTYLSEGIPVYYAIGGEAIEGIIDLGGGQYSVVPGTELTFVAKPAEEHYLVSWNGEAATSDTLKLTMTGELALTANFAHVPYTITLPEGVSIVAPVPAGITDKGNGVYEIVEGTEFQISADSIPAHYHFDHWADLADSVAMYAANPRTIVAGENLTIEPIFAIDTYTLTLATNDSTKGVVSVIGAGSGAGASVGEMISLSEKQTENPVMGEYFQVVGEGVNYEGRIIGRSDDYQLTISSQNGEKLDFIILKVSSKGLWSGYTVSSTAGDVEDLLDNFTIRVSNINATSVTISRSGTTANPTGYIIVSNVYVNEEIPLRADITDRDFPNSGNVLTGNGVTLTAGSFDLVPPQIVGGGTFTTDLGNFTKIEIYAMSFSQFSGEGWTEEGDYARVWTGNASSVSFDGAVIGDEQESIYIAYTIAPASAASGIVDNGDGTYTVDWGTELTFVAKPAEGFMLESWSNGAEVTSDTLKLTMTEELSLTANFKHIPATITLPEGVSIVEPMPAGITAKGEGVYEVEYGTEFQISADSIPAHYHFDHWADLADSVAMYAANPRTIVAGENLTIEPIFAIDTYTLTLASNDTTMGTLRVEGAGGSNIGPREEFDLGNDYPAGEHYQVTGAHSAASWVGIGGNDNATMTIESLNGEIIDNITLKVYFPSNWTGYSIASTSGTVSGDVATYQDLVVTNINATSVTLSRVGEGNASGSVSFHRIIVNGRDAQQGGEAEPITVIITNQDFPSEGNSFTKDGVTVSAETMSANYIADGTFSTTLGNITRIQVTSDARDASGDGWVGSGKTWAGTPASSVPFSGYYSDMHGSIGIKFVITIVPTAAPAAAGIVDNGDGTYTVEWGTEMSIIAEPAEGYMLASWNGEPALSDTLKQTVEGALSINATFKHIPAVITLPEGVSIVGMPIEGITSKGEGVYEEEYGTEFQISADSIPAHYHFDHWADLADSVAMYAANPRTIVAGENLTIEPIFAIDTYTLTLATNDSTKGVVSLEGGLQEPSAQLIVPQSWSSEVGVTITAADLPGFVASTEEAVKALPVPTEGSVFVIYNFKDNGGVEAVTFENGEYVRTTSTPVDHANISYYSNQGMIFLYTTAAGQAGQGGEGGEGGEPSGIVDNGDGTYTVDWGTELTFVAKAAEGYHVQSWSNGAEVNDLVEATQTITMTEALDLSALFAENPIITLATNDSTMGIVTLAGAGNQLTVAGSNMDVNQNIPIRPVSSTDTRTMNQSIYPAAMLTGIAGDSISGMTYYISEPGAHVLTATYVVKLMETEQAAFSDAVAVNTESATTVYTGTIDVTGNTLDIVFDQPYAYNGGNLLVEFSISSASHQNALAKFSVFASQGGSFQQYYNFGFEEMRYYTYDFLAKTTFICGGSKGIPGVIDLGNGQYNVLPGTELTFVAQPAERFMLDSWSNGAPVNGDSLTITVTEPLSLTANFKYIPAVITLPEGVNIVEPVPAGITALGEGVYEVEHGTEFQISADGAPEHYHFDHWTDLDSTNTEYYANPRTVVADTNFTADPFYTIDTYVITLASNDTTMGQLTIEPTEGIVDNGDGTYTVDWGTFLTIKATAVTGYHVDSWSNGEAVNDLVVATQTQTVTDEFDLSALFVANPVITLGANYDAWGTVVIDNIDSIAGLVNFGDGSYSVLPGTELTLVAVPAEDYHLLSWSNGAAVTADNKQTVVVTDELSISASFKHDTYILTVSGVEVQTAKFADGNTTAVVLNPGVLNGVQAGDSVKLTTTAAYSSANVGDNLTIMIHYEIEVIDGGIYDNEYALQVTDETYQDKGAIIEPMNPDEDAPAEDEEAEVKEGLEIYAYGYCHGSSYSIAYHLKSGKPDQYKVVFADSRFTDIDWSDLETPGADGHIDIDVPVDLPTGDYSMTITFRDSRYTWLESAPITVSFHVNLPETYTVVLFDNVMAVVDTCECLTDIQWYHRANSSEAWVAIPGATGYYYKQEGGLSGEYFIKAKMNGVDTYTCPQTDVETLYGEGAAEVVLRVSPNPVVTTTNLTVEGSDKFDHNMRIVNVNGWEVYKDTFEGVETTVDMSNYPQGNYMISVDGVVITVIKK